MTQPSHTCRGKEKMALIVSAVLIGVIIFCATKSKSHGFDSTGAEKPATPAAWAYDAEGTILQALERSTSVDFFCQMFESPAAGEWLIGCAPRQPGDAPYPTFLMFAATTSADKSKTSITALNGHAIRYSELPAFRKYAIGPQTQRADINIPGLVDKFYRLEGF